MTKTQAAGVALFLWMIGFVTLSASDASTLETAVYLFMFFIAYTLIVWEDREKNDVQ